MNGGGVKIQAAHLYPKTHVETPTPVVMDLLFQIFFFLNGGYWLTWTVPYNWIGINLVSNLK